MNARRYLAFALTILMLLGTLVACAETPNDPAETTPAPSITNAPDGSQAEVTENLYDENGFLKSDLPEELDFGGDTITVLWWTDVENPEFFVEDTNGEIVNDAIFERNAKVESQLGITFDWIGIKGQYNNNVGKEYSDHVGNMYASGDKTYDLMSAHSRTIALTAMNGYCADLMQAEYIDFEKPWWPTIMTETATIGDKMYFVTGDVSTNSIHQMYTIFYNKDLFSNYTSLVEPADYVLEDNWTFETLQILTKDIYQDLDGSNSANEGDLYGFTSLNWHFDAFYYGAGLRQAEKDPEDLFKISDDYFGEKAIALCDNLGAWIKQGDVYINSTYFDDVFHAGNSLMTMARHHDIANKLVDGDFKFGIAPIPKYNTEQENYITCVGNPVSFYAIYTLSEDVNRAAAVLECWASEAYRLTSPALFETTFKLRYSDTSTESQMYDLIRAGITFDIGRLFNSSLGAMSDQWDNCAVEGGSWAVKSKALNRTLSKQIQTITDSFKAIN
ncbi:MAG: extracellular solute-binding protein [Clostridia bacterium]|nr:extracellular solute-binding protein [Clostridia bacterium]